MIEWTAEQVCGECGEGVFVSRKYGAACTVCDHVHAMDLSQLGEGERYEWHTVHPNMGPTLHVTAYAATAHTADCHHGMIPRVGSVGFDRCADHGEA